MMNKMGNKLSSLVSRIKRQMQEYSRPTQTYTPPAQTYTSPAQPATGGIDSILGRFDQARQQKIISCVINHHGCCGCEEASACNGYVYRECSSPSGLNSAIQFCTAACGL
jgi:hypothetical protein